ncbi:MAG UNVERIFIED_CONTAM: hypothetical protein LVQ98_00720 [Rickettsiaceae bacterium]
MGSFTFITIFFGIAKTAIFPFHSWLTSAMIAPYPVSALLHAVAVVKAGLFCMMKIIIYIFGISYLYNLLEYFNWPLVMAVVTLLYASYMAVSTNIVKHVLAYSTIANLALVLMSLFVLSNKSIIAGLSHMIVHSFAKITLFFAAGIFYTQVQSTSLNELRGIGYKSPIAAIFFLIAAFSMIGIPPLAGANSKQLIWNSIVESNYSYTLKPVLILYILATIIYMGKLSYLLFAKDANFTSKVSRGGMEFALALTTIPLAAFPLIERYLDSILWSIL